MASQRSTWSRDAAGIAASRACCSGVKGRAGLGAGDPAGGVLSAGQAARGPSPSFRRVGDWGCGGATTGAGAATDSSGVKGSEADPGHGEAREGPGRGRPERGVGRSWPKPDLRRVETGVAEVPRLGPRRQPIARAGGDQLPGERGPGREPWPGAGPLRSGWGDPRAVGPDPVVIVPGVRILLFSILLRSTSPSACAGARPPRAGARSPRAPCTGTGACRGRSQSGSRQVRWIRRPVGFSRDGCRRMYPRSSRRRSDRRTVPGWRWTRAAIELSQGQQLASARAK